MKAAAKIFFLLTLLLAPPVASLAAPGAAAAEGFAPGAAALAFPAPDPAPAFPTPASAPAASASSASSAPVAAASGTSASALPAFPAPDSAPAASASSASSAPASAFPTPASAPAAAQTSPEALKADVEFLADTLCAGRATGTRGCVEAAAYIIRRLSAIGYEPRVQSFRIDSARVGHNILVLPESLAPAASTAPTRPAAVSVRSTTTSVPTTSVSTASATSTSVSTHSTTSASASASVSTRSTTTSVPTASASASTRSTASASSVSYPTVIRKSPRPVIVLTAYYDGLGVLDGRLYPGADSNASGVAALLSVAARIRDRADVVIAFLDGHNANLSGADALRNALRGQRIQLLVNFDILGSTLAPVDKFWPDFLIALGADRHRVLLEECNAGLQLHYYHTYYRSRTFTDVFYRKVGDQRGFLADGVPTIVFTSGITDLTNKPGDAPETLDYPVFAKRVEFISRFISRYGR